jgi:hypothetical protein
MERTTRGRTGLPILRCRVATTFARMRMPMHSVRLLADAGLAD